MQNNVNFRDELMISYMDSLTDYDHNEEFNRLFAQIETKLKAMVANSNNRNLLEKIKRIIAYKEKNKKIAI